MTESNDWKRFFDQHADKYMDEPFVTGTLAEVDFLIEHLKLTSDQRILDMGCGTGRHALELARRGYQVTGVDLSDGMLDQGRQIAEAEGLSTVTFEQADATQYTTDTLFDRVYGVCEGALGLIGYSGDPHTHDLTILRNLYNALRPGGLLMLTVLNAMRHIRLYQQADVEAGAFDPATLTERSMMETGEGDQRVEIVARERGFVIPELHLMLEVTGFEVQHIGGGTAGNWGIRPVELDEYELMAIARKPT
ncbi:MAG: class I SAM-dependent methyltransferase [Chloroflexi bacterium]|nr:class I SAM-dependent methyltransferase [Chloroflexota bacterium]